MKIRWRTRPIRFFGDAIVFDGWEVLLGASLACFALGGVFGQVRTLLFWVGGVLLVLWLISVFLVNRFPKREPPSEGGGPAPADDTSE